MVQFVKKKEIDGQNYYFWGINSSLRFHFHCYKQEKGVTDLKTASVHNWLMLLDDWAELVMFLILWWGNKIHHIPDRSPQPSQAVGETAGLMEFNNGKKGEKFVAQHWGNNFKLALQTHALDTTQQQLCIWAGGGLQRVQSLAEVQPEDLLPQSHAGSRRENRVVSAYL